VGTSRLCNSISLFGLYTPESVSVINLLVTSNRFEVYGEINFDIFIHVYYRYTQYSSIFFFDFLLSLYLYKVCI